MAGREPIVVEQVRAPTAEVEVLIGELDLSGREEA
jgi:hypothetical protein